MSAEDLTEEFKKLPDTDVSASPDAKAKKEEEAIFSGEYDEDAKRQDHRRLQGIKNIAYYAILILVVIGVGLVIMLAVVWFWHLLAPHKVRWLEPIEIDHVQSLLFSGSLASALTMMGTKFLRF